jgi:chaperonin GroEL (HSP60 family)
MNGEEKKDYFRSKGDVHKDNILVAKTLGETVRRSLGPRGMKKLLIDSLGYYVVSSDEARMLECMSLWHPVAKIMINSALVQKKSMGDGSISVIILISELLKQAEVLLDQKFHPMSIVKGYEEASRKVQKILDEISVEIDVSDKEMLKNVAFTSIRSKFDEIESQILAGMVTDSIDQMAKRNSILDFDLDQIHIVKKPFGSIIESSLFEGIVLDETVTHPRMPRTVRDARIAVLACPLEIEKFEHMPPSVRGNININSPEQFESYLVEENRIIENWLERIESSGATVVFCKKRINDLVQYRLAKKGIMAVTLWRFSAKDKYLARIARDCGANIVNNLQDLEAKDLGFAESVEEREVGSSKAVFIEGCRDPASISLIIRGLSKELIDDAERAVLGSIYSVRNLFLRNRALAGGGAAFIELRERLTQFSLEFDTREQISIGAFADAMRAIPETLIRSTGLDIIDNISLLTSRHHEVENSWEGMDVIQKSVSDMMKAQVIEPLLSLKQVISSASETAIMILRTDRIMNKKDESESVPDDLPGKQLPGFLSAGHRPEFKGWEKDHTVF